MEFSRTWIHLRASDTPLAERTFESGAFVVPFLTLTRARSRVTNSGFDRSSDDTFPIPGDQSPLNWLFDL